MSAITLESVRAEAAATPLDQIDVSRPERFAANAHWPLFDRLRAEDPVHFCADSAFNHSVILTDPLPAGPTVFCFMVWAARCRAGLLL